MTKNCRQCHASFNITAGDLAFYDKISPVFAGKKYQIPQPTLCPDCRQQRRLAFRNQNKLYPRQCDLCKKEIISIYAFEPAMGGMKGKPYTVYCPDCWWSDRWDALQYGRTFDFNRPFFEQFHQLKQEVPHVSLHVSNNENSDYINLSGYNKNCHLIFAGEYNQDCLYGTQVIKSEKCIDTLNCLDSQYCYDVVDVEKCYQLFFSKNCKNCSESMFLYDCRSCSNCFFCVNLRNKQYHIFNKPYSKEEYERKKADILGQIKAGKIDELKKYFEELHKTAVHKSLEIVNSEGSNGDYISDSKNADICFDLAHGQDCRYAFTAYNVKDVMDVAHATEVELSYEGTSIGYKSYNVHFAMGAWSSNNGYYLDNVHSSSDLFGCVGLRQKKYCILNKQYSKEEYEKLVPQIIENMGDTKEWGEFFPMSLSPFGYNETLAFEYFPLSQENAIQLGAKWKESQAPNPAEKAAAKSKTQDLLNCSKCGKIYKLTQQEIEFYEKMMLTPPKECPPCRHEARLMSRHHRKLWNQTCSKCGTGLQTTYAPDRPEIIYCQSCYLKEVY